VTFFTPLTHNGTGGSHTEHTKGKERKKRWKRGWGRNEAERTEKLERQKENKKGSKPIYETALKTTKGVCQVGKTVIFNYNSVISRFKKAV